MTKLNIVGTIVTSNLAAPEGVNQMRELVYCPLETTASWTQMTLLYVLQTWLGSIVLTARQVSPYNLWSVRALRYFSVLFAIVTFLWWVLLLVSIFVSPPMMHSRGSGFFDFSYTYPWQPSRRYTLLLYAFQSNASG